MATKASGLVELCTRNSRLLLGNALHALKHLHDESVHCVVTSPPYWSLRDYQTAAWEGGDSKCDHKERSNYAGTRDGMGKLPGSGKRRDSDGGKLFPTTFLHHCGKCGATRIDDQLGLEETPQEYITKLVAIMRQVRRVLRSDGTLWLNLGDTYGGGTTGGYSSKSGLAGFTNANTKGRQMANNQKNATKTKSPLASGQLQGIPWRVALALQEDGWFLRADIVWCKPNPMPESCRNRTTKAHEYLFLLTKKATYFYDNVAIYESATGRAAQNKGVQPQGLSLVSEVHWNERNKRSWWVIPTKPTKEAHFATFPPRLVDPCILAGTSLKGCCPKCGAQKVRITKRVREATRPALDTKTAGLEAKVIGNRDPERHVSTVKTTGWEYTCECGGDLPSVPCTVLDPFAGMATTGQVAIKRGRKFIGVELNEDYMRAAHRKLQQAERGKGFVGF